MTNGPVVLQNEEEEMDTNSNYSHGYRHFISHQWCIHHSLVWGETKEIFTVLNNANRVHGKPTKAVSTYIAHITSYYYNVLRTTRVILDMF